MSTKICSKCGRELPLENFHWRNKEKGLRRADCKECHSNHMKQVYQKKKDTIQELKSQCKCAKCGDDRGYILDYHHINPNEKETTIARMTSNCYTLDKVYNEIEKCIVLCANCHREFHYFNTKDTSFSLEQYLNSPLS